MISKIFKNLEKIFIQKFIIGNDKREKIFKEEGLVKVLSPGRINIIGEHTDYNLGLSMPLAIDKYKFFIGMKNNSDKVEIYDNFLDEYYIFSLKDIVYDKDIKWSNYIKGVISEYINRGNKISGFSMVIDSNLPSGAGISASAAILAGVAQVIEEIFKLNSPKLDMMHYCHDAENSFVNVDNGFLDHFAVIYGKKNNALFLNFKDLSYDYVPLDLKDFVFLIVDSKEERHLPETDYNKRGYECNLALEKIIELTGNRDFKSLSDIDIHLLNTLHDKLEGKLFKRVKHVVTENNRVLEAKEYLQKNEFESLGKLLFESHKSLKDEYEVSTERLDFLINSCMSINGVPGARLMGAGFGGSILCLVRNDKVDLIERKLNKEYYKEFNQTPDFISCNFSDGVMVYRGI